VVSIGDLVNWTISAQDGAIEQLQKLHRGALRKLPVQGRLVYPIK